MVEVRVVEARTAEVWEMEACMMQVHMVQARDAPVGESAEPLFHGDPVRSSQSQQQALAPYHAYSPNEVSSSPKNHRVVVPARQAYSHSASVGSRYTGCPPAVFNR